MYWDSEKVDGGVALKDLEDKAHADAKGHYWPKQDNVEVVIPVQQSAQRVASPAPGRRWSRKIDQNVFDMELPLYAMCLYYSLSLRYFKFNGYLFDPLHSLTLAIQKFNEGEKSIL